jgi:hypothetical protein
MRRSSRSRRPLPLALHNQRQKTGAEKKVKKSVRDIRGVAHACIRDGSGGLSTIVVSMLKLKRLMTRPEALLLFNAQAVPALNAAEFQRLCR